MTQAGNSTDPSPTIHFDQESRIVDQNGESVEITIIQFVKKGTCLVTLPDASKETKSDQDQTSIKLIAGENTILSNDQNTIIADVNGYPEIIEKNNSNIHTIDVTVTPLISITSDKMFATLTLHPATVGASSIEFEDLEHFLAEEGVCYGIDKQAVDQCVLNLKEQNSTKIKVVGARGILPVNGRDAYLRFEMETGPIAGKLLQNGKIDFRERKMFVSIDQDQLVATKISATEGVSGKNIHGETLTQKVGKDVNFSISEDVVYGPETQEIRATKSGLLSITNEKTIKVCSRQIISGDVDYSVGNVESKNSLEISGNVKPAFNIMARGDILIGGNVNSAIITSRANVVIKGGLLGKTGLLTVRGDVDINFVERGKIKAGGTIVIRNEAYYAEIIADGNIHCSEESRIVGGIVLCGGDFSGGTIGSPNAEPTRVGAGISSSRYSQHLELQEQITALEEKIVSFKQHHGKKNCESEIYLEMTTDVQKFQMNLSKLNLIPETPEYSLREPLMDFTESEITVHGTIVAGTHVHIGNHGVVLEADYSLIKFTLDREQQKIVIRDL